MAFVVRKQSTTTKKISSPVPVTRMRDALDADFGTLDSVQDGRFVAFNSTTGKFNLNTADDLFAKAIEDGSLPSGFITNLENQMSYDALIPDIDGGTF
tara:strand:+ start:1372 stop:1665 length:294 start_codon:yes stop_codon:yes gene_type:complete